MSSRNLDVLKDSVFDLSGKTCEVCGRIIGEPITCWTLDICGCCLKDAEAIILKSCETIKKNKAKKLLTYIRKG